MWSPSVKGTYNTKPKLINTSIYNLWQNAPLKATLLCPSFLTSERRGRLARFLSYLCGYGFLSMSSSMLGCRRRSNLYSSHLGWSWSMLMALVAMVTFYDLKSFRFVGYLMVAWVMPNKIVWNEQEGISLSCGYWKTAILSLLSAMMQPTISTEQFRWNGKRRQGVVQFLNQKLRPNFRIIAVQLYGSYWMCCLLQRNQHSQNKVLSNR